MVKNKLFIVKHPSISLGYYLIWAENKVDAIFKAEPHLRNDELELSLDDVFEANFDEFGVSIDLEGLE